MKRKEEGANLANVARGSMSWVGLDDGSAEGIFVMLCSELYVL